MINGEGLTLLTEEKEEEKKEKVKEIKYYLESNYPDFELKITNNNNNNDFEFNFENKPFPNIFSFLNNYVENILGQFLGQNILK